MPACFAAGRKFRRPIKSVMLALLLLFTVRTAQAKPSALLLRKVPPAVQAALPTGARSDGAVQVGAHLLHWYEHKGNPHGALWLAIWSRTDARGPWRLKRRVLLPKDALPLGADDSAGRRVPVDWLQPKRKIGPILVLNQVYYSSFYVFPEGMDGPLWVWSGGSGDAGWNCTFYRLGPPDRRGFRVMNGRSQSGVRDANDDPVDEVTVWKRYWTGKGWTFRGADRTFLDKAASASP